MQFDSELLGAFLNIDVLCFCCRAAFFLTWISQSKGMEHLDGEIRLERCSQSKCSSLKETWRGLSQFAHGIQGKVAPDSLHLCFPPLLLQLEVKMQVEYMSFSAHADAKGIMQLIRQAEPRNVLLVHGEAKKMEFLKQKIEQEFRT